MFPRRWHHSFIAALCSGWVFIVAVGASGEEATTPQVSAVTTAQAGAAAVQNFTEFLKLEAERAERATKHESEAIERALTVFEYVVGFAGTILVAGGAAVGWALAGNRAQIQREVRARIRAGAVEEIESQIGAQRERLETQRLHLEHTDKAARELGDRLDVATGQVSSTESRLNEQQNITKQLQNITSQLQEQQEINRKLITILGRGSFPYAYLKDIYNKKRNTDPNQEFIFQDQTAFKRELGFLIDNGFIDNVNLDLFADQENILDKLTITDAGREYLALIEGFIPKPKSGQALDGRVAARLC